MKTLRRTCAIAILTLLVSVAGFAGQIQTPGITSVGHTATNITTSMILAIINLAT